MIIFYNDVEDAIGARSGLTGPRGPDPGRELSVQHFITQYGYLAVFVLMLAESACIPVPSEVAGAHPSLAGIIIAGVLGNVAGSYVAWAAGRYAGQAAVRRWGRRFGIREREIDRAAAWFERHGNAAVLVGRVIPVVRTFISLPAGFAAMPPVRFGVYTTLGCIPWTAALGIAGYALGANWQSVANGFHGPTYAIAGILVAAIAVAVIVGVRRSRRGRAGTPGGRGADEEGAGQPLRLPTVTRGAGETGRSRADGCRLVAGMRPRAPLTGMTENNRKGPHR
jgi:membrane protein DedA with SNARE-associated domain